MKKIGITGGIGSGKTTVCEIFKLLGIAVFHADTEAKKLQDNDLQIKRLLIERLGEFIYLPNGMLDRTKMAKLIFNDKKALSDVNSIIHPAVQKTFLNWANKYQDAPYVLYEAAILLESGYASDFDRNILIQADENIRIGRVIMRDNISKELVMQRIRNQMTDIKKVRLVDFIIENNNKKLLIPQVIELDKLIRKEDENQPGSKAK